MSQGTAGWELYDINMSFLIFIAIVIVILVAIKEGISSKNSNIGFFGEISSDANMPYRKKDYLLTVTEKNFYTVLKKVADDHDCIVFAKVRLEDLIWIPKSTHNILKWRGYVRSRHIDFVLCEKKDIKPICAIELDDASHNTFSANKTDNLKDNILRTAGLPLLRIKASYEYDVTNLTQEIENKIYSQKGV